MPAEPTITHIVTETITLATGELTKASNAPRGAAMLSVRGTGNPTWQLTPAIRYAAHFDASAGTYTDHTRALTTRGTGLFAEIDLFDFTPADQFYIACDVPFRGLRVNVKNANAEVSVMTVEYDVAGVWTDISDTDATASGGATLAIDNIITWTVPTNWTKTTLNGIGPHFMVRFNVSADLGADVQIAEIVPLSVFTNQIVAEVVDVTSTAHGALPRYFIDTGTVGGIETTGDNTDTLVANWMCSGRSITFVTE